VGEATTISDASSAYRFDVVPAGPAKRTFGLIFGSMRVRHLGPRPLAEDATVTSPSTTVWNGGLGYHLSSRARIVLDVFNRLDAKVSGIDYFYPSQLPGEPLAGVNHVQRIPHCRARPAPDCAYHSEG
jgi:hypothetical protein